MKSKRNILTFKTIGAVKIFCPPPNTGLNILTLMTQAEAGFKLYKIQLMINGIIYFKIFLFLLSLKYGSLYGHRLHFTVRYGNNIV